MRRDGGRDRGAGVSGTRTRGSDRNWHDSRRGEVVRLAEYQPRSYENVPVVPFARFRTAIPRVNRTPLSTLRHIVPGWISSCFIEQELQLLRPTVSET